MPVNPLVPEITSK